MDAIGYFGQKTNTAPVAGKRQKHIDIKQNASSEIAWNIACDHLHDGTARETFRENAVAGHYGVATGAITTAVLVVFT